MKRSALVVELENKLSDMIGPNGGLQEARWIGQFVNLMAETTNVEGRDVLLQALLRTTQNTKAIYGRFSSVGGIEQLGKWIKDHEKNEQSEDRGLLHTILSCLNKLPVTTEILEATMIGKAVKSICKHSELGLQAKAVALIKKWASAIENPSEVHRPPKPNFNETKIELPKRQKVEEQVPIEEIHSDPETNEYHDFSKKRVRWVDDDRLERPKYFWRSDEPNAVCASQRPSYCPSPEAHENINVEEFKKREIQMERELNHKVKNRQEKEKDISIKVILENMTPRVNYSNLCKLIISSTQRKKNESTELQEENRRESNALKTIYQRESEIPKTPIETNAISQLNGSMVSIPYMRSGCYLKSIKINNSEEPQSVRSPQYISPYTNPMPVEVPLISQPPQMLPVQSSIPLQIPQMQAPQLLPQMTQMRPMSGVPQMPINPMNQMHQVMTMHPSMPMGQMGQMNQIPQMGQMGQVPNPMMPMYMPYVPQSQSYPMPGQGVNPYMGIPPQAPRGQPVYQPNMLKYNYDTNANANKRQIIYNPVTKKPQNYRTMPCKKFHSQEGCNHADNCHFIHDFNFQGRPIPNFQEWKNTNAERQKHLMENTGGEMGAIYYPPMGQMQFPPEVNK